MIGRVAAILVAVILALVSMREACACDSPLAGLEDASAADGVADPSAESNPEDEREEPGDEDNEPCGCLCCPANGFTTPAPVGGVEALVATPATPAWVVHQASPRDFRPRVFHPPR